MAKQSTSGVLNDRQNRFVKEYLIDCNAKQAAIRAGYSAKTAEQIGSRLLRHVVVRAAIDAAMTRRAEKVGLSAESVLRQLQRMVEADIAQCFDEHGNLKPIHEIPVELRTAIASVESEELWEGRGEDRVRIGSARKVKLWDKNSAIEKAMKHLGLLKERVEHTGAGGGPIQTETRDYGPMLRRFRAGGK
jgi:phage terminase small subunit